MKTTLPFRLKPIFPVPVFPVAFLRIIVRRIAVPLIAVLLSFAACTRPEPAAGESVQTALGSEPWRPRIHFSPDSMWMNDPNGMVYFDGEYHLFYQYYPGDKVWGPMHWGHAVSPDMVRWEHLPVALVPDSLGYIFSGSAVADPANTSRLGQDGRTPLVAVFTHHDPDLARDGSDVFQVQSLAFSLDRGRTWTKYGGNPVLANPGIRDFRDPKVSWFADRSCWIMVLAVQDRVHFYSSPDLRTWTRESEFGPGWGTHEGVWECPDLFPMDLYGQQKWVLLVSVNPGGPQGGSGTQYFVGDFDGSRFVPEQNPTDTLWMDGGADNYAGVSWSGVPAEDGRRLLLGWMSNWAYAQQVPTHPWRSAMTLPRSLFLFDAGGETHLGSRPVRELASLRKDSVPLVPGPVTALREISEISGMDAGPFEVDLTLRVPGGRADLGIVFSNDEGEEVRAGFRNPGGELYVDRTRSGDGAFSNGFAATHVHPLRMDPGEELTLRVYLDQSSVEVFAEDGKAVMTDLVFPTRPFNRIAIYCGEGETELVSGTLYPLKGFRDGH
ncbi:MAG: glycoside hydrolase family 32 protein [Bacteroidales bacterium]